MTGARAVVADMIIVGTVGPVLEIAGLPLGVIKLVRAQPALARACLRGHGAGLAAFATMVNADA